MDYHISGGPLAKDHHTSEDSFQHERLKLALSLEDADAHLRREKK
jgi:hypothetical protein